MSRVGRVKKGKEVEKDEHDCPREGQDGLDMAGDPGSVPRKELPQRMGGG